MKIRSTKKVKLSNSEWLYHFRVSFFLMIPVVLLCFAYFGSSSRPPTSPVELLLIALLFFLIALFLYWRNQRRLYYFEHPIKLSEEEFEKTVTTTAEELNWRIDRLGPDQMIAHRYLEEWQEASEKISVFKTTYRLYVNSIANPEGMFRAASSSSRNEENVTIFINNARNIHEGKDIEAIIEERRQHAQAAFNQESELTLVKILKRLVAYGLTTIFALLTYLMLAEGEWAVLFVMAIPLGLCFIYIKSDMELILKKNRRNP